MPLTKTLSLTSWDYWRIVLALAGKDIVDAIRNKTTLTIMFGLATMMLTVQALPLLLKLDSRPRLAIYDAARTSTADELRRGRAVQLSEMRTAEDAVNAAREASGPLLAVTLPAGWSESADPLTVDGYLAHSVRPGTAETITEQAEQALSGVTGRQVIIETAIVYPTLDNGGHTTMVSLGLVLATVLITTILVPHLILEEKRTHTLDLLRVSPASINQVLLGKALAGCVYGFLAAAVLVAFNLSMVNLWSILLLALLGIILFGVGLGLLIGTVAETESSLQGWVGILVIAVIAPLIITFMNNSRLPAWVQQLGTWLPTTAGYDLIRLSFSEVAAAAELWPRLAALLVAVVAVFAAAGWRLRAWE